MYEERKRKVKLVIVSIQSHSIYGSSHTELNLSTDLQCIHRLHRLGLHAAWLVNRFKVFGAERFATGLS